MRDVVALTLTIVVAVVIGRLIAARFPLHAWEGGPVREEGPVRVGRPLTGNPILDYIHERYPDAI